MRAWECAAINAYSHWRVEALRIKKNKIGQSVIIEIGEVDNAGARQLLNSSTFPEIIVRSAEKYFDSLAVCRCNHVHESI